MKQGTDVLIIGGGIIGCALAFYLRQAKVEVTVIERGTIAGEASGAAAGLLAPLGPLSGPGPLADLLLAGFAMFESLAPELEERTNIHLEYAQTGALRLVRNPRRVSSLQKRMQAWQPLGLKMQWLTGEEARQQEPLLAGDVCGAVFAPQEAQIDAKRLVQAFAKAAQTDGARFIEHQEAVQVNTHQQKVTGVRTRKGETIACGSLVLATGAWTGLWSERLQCSLPITPLHGQLLAFVAPSSPGLGHLIFGDGTYLVPRADALLVGATKEEVGFDSQVRETATTWLSTTAKRLLPTLAHAQVHATWAGLRPKTPDTRPLLGRLPTWKNVFLAAGHNSIGILLSAITGQTMTELITTGHLPPLLHPFSPARFDQSHEQEEDLFSQQPLT